MIPPNESFWKFVGPRNLLADRRFVSGRVNAVTFVPGASGTYYVGAAGGGVWKTTDAGATWSPLSNTWLFQAVSSIAIDPNQPNTLYVGTGDFAGDGVQSFGLMKSTDGGATFTNLAATETADTSISRIVVDPDQSSIVVMTSGGRAQPGAGRVWRSTTSGSSWNPVVNIPADWGDVAVGARDASGARWYYAAGWNASGSMVYASHNRGANWTPLTLPVNSAVPSILALATSPRNSEQLYLLVGSARKVFSRGNAGGSWTDITGNLPQDDGAWGQENYDWFLKCGEASVVNFGDVDVLFLGLKEVFWLVPGGAWMTLAGTHADQHDLAINPNGERNVLLGNDGGAWLMSYVDSVGGPTWIPNSLNADLGITQVYKGAFSSTDPNTILAGGQDNGALSAQGDLNAWRQVDLPRTTDTGPCVISPTNINIQFASLTTEFYGIIRTEDRWQAQKEITPQPLPDDVIPPGGPLAMDSAGQHLFWGTNFLWMWDEATRAWTPHVGGQKLANTSLAGEVLQTIAIAPSDNTRVYTGAGTGEVWMSRAPHPTWDWVQINAGSTSLPNQPVLSISVHPNDPNDVLVGLGGGGTGNVWRCTDPQSMQPHWYNVSGAGTLPDSSVNAVTRDPVDPRNTWYIGTDVGVFYTEDSGATWHDLRQAYGMPNVIVKDLVTAGSYLNAATFGRGIWQAALIKAGMPWHIVQIVPNGSFGGWSRLGDAAGVGQMMVISGINGGLEVFAVDTGAGFVWTIFQDGPNGNFEGWRIVGNKTGFRQVTAGRNADGRLEVFAIDAQGVPWHTAQPTPSSGFPDWLQLGGGVGLGQITVISTHSGSLEVFATDTSAGLAWTIFQDGPNGNWEGWVRVGDGVGLRQIAVGKNADDRLEVFAIDTQGVPWRTVQPTPSSAFGNWSQLGGGVGLGQITVISTHSGSLEVFATDTSAGLAWTIFQDGPNGNWEGWVRVADGVGLRQIAAGKNADGRLEVFALDTNGRAWHTAQPTPSSGFPDWSRLGDAAGLYEVAVGQNADGRLEVFAVLR